MLSIFLFSPLMTVGGSEILSEQNDVAQPDFELTFKKTTDGRVVDRLANK